MKEALEITFLDKYFSTLDKTWSKIPSIIGSCLATIAIFIFGISVRGDWLLVLVHFARYLKHGTVDNGTVTMDGSSLLSQYKLDNLVYYVIGSNAMAFVMYFFIGGFVHWYFYILKRDKAEEWKCQPKKWNTLKMDLEAVKYGVVTLAISSTFSAFVTCYSANGGSRTTLYYNISDYGWLYWIIQFPLIYMYTDYLIYWHHRMHHTPFFYKNFHKLHHKWKHPTAFTVTAVHPVEFVQLQIISFSPMFMVPCHYIPLFGCLIYGYYHAIIDHSGINFKSYWWQPWQPDCIFHDNHHQYFHLNFGFNMSLWDKLHGTYRRKDRIYREDIFYGHGKPLENASKEEKMMDLEERHAENPKAYKSNQNEFLANKVSKKKS